MIESGMTVNCVNPKGKGVVVPAIVDAVSDAGWTQMVSGHFEDPESESGSTFVHGPYLPFPTTEEQRAAALAIDEGGPSWFEPLE